MDARERSGATALCGTFTLIPDLGARNGFCMGRHGEPCEWTQWSLRSDGLTRVVYPDPPVRSESGVWNDMRSAANERNGKGRSYGLTRVEYPDPRSRSEKRGLERHGKACVVDAMEESELRPFAQPRHLGARSEVWNDMRSSAWWTKKEEKKKERHPGEGHLSSSPISERERGSGTAGGARQQKANWCDCGVGQ